MMLTTYFFVKFKSCPSNFMCQGYDIKLCIQKGSSSSSILVDLHFIFSGTAEDAAIICLYCCQQYVEYHLDASTTLCCVWSAHKITTLNLSIIVL